MAVAEELNFFKETLSIVNLAVLDGVKATRFVEDVAINLSVYVPFALTAVPVQPQKEGVTVPVVHPDIV